MFLHLIDLLFILTMYIQLNHLHIDNFFSNFSSYAIKFGKPVYFCRKQDHYLCHLSALLKNAYSKCCKQIVIIITCMDRHEYLCSIRHALKHFKCFIC